MLACLDPMYAWKDPAPFLDMGKTMKWMGGGHRIIQTLIVSLLYPNHEKEALEWKKAWLERSGFQSGGVIPNIARKSRKQYVDTVTDAFFVVEVHWLTSLGSIFARCITQLVMMSRISSNEVPRSKHALPSSGRLCDCLLLTIPQEQQT